MLEYRYVRKNLRGCIRVECLDRRGNIAFVAFREKGKRTWELPDKPNNSFLASQICDHFLTCPASNRIRFTKG